MENLNAALDTATQFLMDTWRQVVQGTYPGGPELHFETIKQRRDYLDSITLGKNLDMPEAGRWERTVIATSKISEDIEKGRGPWDMKPMLLGGPKARLGKNGNMYNIIPFRHGTVERENSQFRPMPKDILEKARALTPTLAGTRIVMNHATGKMGNRAAIVQYGQRLTGTEEQYPRRTKTFYYEQNGVLKKGSYTHKAGIYEGMIKVQASYGKKTQSQYLTFRCVSDASNPMSWWHPGKKAQPHIQFVLDSCRPTIERKLTEAAQLDMINLNNISVGMTISVS